MAISAPITINPKQSRSEDEPLARSIGQIIEEHLDEIVGPETARRVREAAPQ